MDQNYVGTVHIQVKVTVTAPYHCLATASKQSLLGKAYNNPDNDVFYESNSRLYKKIHSVGVFSSSSELLFSTAFKVLQRSLLSSDKCLQFFKFVYVYCATVINIYRTVQQVVVSSYIDIPQLLREHHS
jgi:hypothetical protein